MRAGIDVQSNALILRVRDADLLGIFLRGDRMTFVEQSKHRLRQQLAYQPIKRVLAAPEIVGDRLRLISARAFVSYFKALVAAVHIDNVPLFRKFDAVFVREFVEAPEHDANALRFAQMKTVG